MKEVNLDNFEAEVLKKTGKVLVDFNADWCGPCQMQKPILEKLTADFQIVSVNIDDAPELAEKYEVSSIPCMILFENGEEVQRKIGLTSESEIKKMLEK